MGSMTLLRIFRQISTKMLQTDKNLTMDVRSGGTLNLFLNTTEGVMADEKVRQAGSRST